MKVLHVIPSISERSGGPGQAIVPMCRALQEKGIEVLIATTDHGVTLPVSRLELGTTEAQLVKPFPPERPEPNGHKSDGTWSSYKDIPTIFFPSQFGDSFKYSRPLAVWLGANVESFDVVHIHAVFNHACLAAARACRRHNVPYIIRPLGTLAPWSMKQKPWRKALFWQLAAKRMLRDAAAVHYTARAEQEETEQSLGLNHGRVVPLGIEADIAAEQLTQENFMSEFPEIATHPYVVMLSRLHPKKGLDVFLAAFISVIQQKEFEDWRLVLAGEGPAEYVALLKHKVNAQNAGGVVVFPGWLEDKRKYAVLRHASILALPSYQENFGLCVMEAMACGIPVLVSPHVNLAEEIEDAGAGWIADVEIHALKDALMKAMASKSECLQRGRAGQEFAKGFTANRCATELIDLYTELRSAGAA